MNIRIRNLLGSIPFVVMISACSNHPILQSATPDMVVLKAQPEMFIEAFDIAKKKCQENTKNAVYIPDYSPDIQIVAFNCIGEEIAAEAEEAPAETESTESETDEVLAEAEELSVATEETEAEAEEVSPQ